MAIVSAEKFVQAARENGYAVGGFNTNNLEWTQAILRAAEAKQAPVLIQTSMGAAKYMGGYKVCQSLIANLVESMGITVPVAIHLDHGHYEDALECIEVGYTSIMFDGSHLPVEENLAKTAEVVKIAHAKGVSVEAEVGTIGGEEDGIIGKGELAPIEDAKAMVETGIDFLAAGIGNIHGPYPENWEGLALDHLEKLTAAVPASQSYCTVVLVFLTIKSKKQSVLVLLKLTLTLKAKLLSLTQLVNLLVTTKLTKQNTMVKNYLTHVNSWLQV